MKTVCIFAGSNLGNNPEFEDKAKELGRIIAKRGMSIIYGGSKNGLMGAIANEVLHAGGKVIGIMPKGLKTGENVHPLLTQLVEVDTMHERKAKMSELADGYVALPGGLGTFEELFEVLCWAQIGIHQKPIGVFNINGFYDPFLRLVNHSMETGFSNNAPIKIMNISSNPEELISMMEQYVPDTSNFKWKHLEI